MSGPRAELRSMIRPLMAAGLLSFAPHSRWIFAGQCTRDGAGIEEPPAKQGMTKGICFPYLTRVY